MDVETMYKHLGNPGRYHVILYVMLLLDWIPVNNNNLIMAFYGAVPDHHCKVPPGGPANESIPTVETDDGFVVDKCHVYVNGSRGGHSMVACNEWTYYTEPGERTIVTEFNLVCDQAYLSNLATTIYFIGVMLGGVIFGTLADRFGRRPLLFITLYVPIGLGASLYFVHNYVVFVVIRFIIGALMQGLEICSFVLVMELFRPRHRTLCGCAINLSYALGNMWIALLSYLLKDWHYIQLALCLPTLLLLCQIWIVPESPRWLLATNKITEIKAFCEKAAKFNGTSLPPGFLSEEKIEHLIAKKTKEAETNEAPSSYSIADLFRTPQIRKRSLILFYVWFVMNLGYYGLSFNISSLAGNKYVNFFIGALLEVPAYITASVITLKLGRRRPLCAYLVLGGVCCIASGSIPKTTHDGVDIQWLSTAFALLGRFGMASVVCVMFLYTSELFPTVIRNIGVGCCAFFTRFGGVLAPQILQVGYHTNMAELPVIVIGGLALIACVASIFLPETKGRNLPDTIEDAESFGLHDDTGKDREEIIIVDESKQSML